MKWTKSADIPDFGRNLQPEFEWASWLSFGVVGRLMPWDNRQKFALVPLLAKRKGQATLLWTITEVTNKTLSTDGLASDELDGQNINRTFRKGAR